MDGSGANEQRKRKTEIKWNANEEMRWKLRENLKLGDYFK